MKIAFDIIPYGERVPNVYKQVHCHMIFDVKMEDFRRKARLVADGIMNKTLKGQTYSIIVSRENFYLALTITALNDP